MQIWSRLCVTATGQWHFFFIAGTGEAAYIVTVSPSCFAILEFPIIYSLFTMDDSYICPTYSYTENIDYMGKADIPNHHLHLCWKRNNSVTIKSHQDDICLTIPSTISRRLENICWRRWNKQLHLLNEISPAHINWNKTQDITWLYGPKYTEPSPLEEDMPRLTSDNLHKMSYNDVPDMELDDVSSVGLASTMSFDDVSLIDTVEEEEFELYGLKLALRRTPSTKKKLVKFSFIVNSREFVNGILFDYDFLDTQCL